MQRHARFWYPILNAAVAPHPLLVCGGGGPVDSALPKPHRAVVTQTVKDGIPKDRGNGEECSRQHARTRRQSVLSV